MSKEVKVPDIGDFTDVEIIEVHVQAGDDIHEEDAIVTLETDKASMEVPSPASGKVGELSSGSLSPCLGLGIGLAYLPADLSRPGTELLIAIRDKTYPAKVVKKPFV